MIGKSSAPTQLVINKSGKNVITRRLVFRNIAQQAVVLKLVVSNNTNGAISFSHDRLRLSGRNTLYIEVTIDRSKLSASKPCTISGFLACIQPYNLKDLESWMNNPKVQPKHQLAFQLPVKIDNSFSAFETVIDLPGSATLVDHVRNATEGVDVSDTVTCKPMDGDAITARPYGSQEDFVKEIQKQKAATASQKSEGSCWIYDLATQMIGLGAPAPAPKKECSVKSRKSQRSKKSEGSKKCETACSTKSTKNIRKIRAGGVGEKPVVQSQYINDEMNAQPCGGN